MSETRTTAHLFGLSQAQLEAVTDHVLDNTPTPPGLTKYGLYANRPAPGVAGNRYIASDGRVEFVDDGSSWRPYINGVVGTQPPTISNFSPIAAGATFADQAGAIVMTGTSGAVDTFAGLGTPKGNTITVEAFFTWSMLTWNAGDAAAVGIFVQDSASTVLTSFGVIWENIIQVMPAVLSYEVDDNTNPGTWTSTVFYNTIATSLGGVWLRFKDTGVNHTFEISANSKDWILVGSRPRATFVPGGGDRVGFYIYTAVQDAKTAALLSWKVD